MISIHRFSPVVISRSFNSALAITFAFGAVLIAATFSDCETRYLQTFNLKYALTSLLIIPLVLFSSIAVGRTQDLGGTPGWTFFGIEGDVAYVPVRLDGYNLFSITAARTKEGAMGIGQPPDPAQSHRKSTEVSA
jgi:hypothetical protein